LLANSDLTNGIIGAAIEVHIELGPGFLENAYEECLCRELLRQGLHFERQKPLPVIYKGDVVDCAYRLDIIVEGSVIVELKSVEALSKLHEAQLLTYLKLSGLSIGLLINFNVRRLTEGLKRMVLGVEG
jgi:GxxExxY protein